MLAVQHVVSVGLAGCFTNLSVVGACKWWNRMPTLIYKSYQIFSVLHGICVLLPSCFELWIIPIDQRTTVQDVIWTSIALHCLTFYTFFSFLTRHGRKKMKHYQNRKWNLMKLVITVIRWFWACLHRGVYFVWHSFRCCHGQGASRCFTSYGSGLSI